MSFNEEGRSVTYTYNYAEKSDLDIARHINLALLLCNGISEQDAGFDMIVGINDKGLEQVARIIGEVRKACAKEDVA